MTLRYVRRRDNRTMWAAVEAFLIERDGEGCFYCGSGHWTFDHVTPRHRGSDSPDNLVLACVDCNMRKGPGAGWLFVLREWARSDSNGLRHSQRVYSPPRLSNSGARPSVIVGNPLVSSPDNF